MSEQTDKPMTPESRRYTAEELHFMAEHCDFSRRDPMLPYMLLQAAEDAAVLEQLDDALCQSDEDWSLPAIELMRRVREEIHHGR